MSQRQIELGQVTRIEGALKVSINLDQVGDVSRAHANIIEFRGFEKFLIGRLFYKAPIITTRICGVCPIPHHLAVGQGLRFRFRPSDTTDRCYASRADANGDVH